MVFSFGGPTGMRLACRLGQCFKTLCILRSPPETRTPLDPPYIFLENGTQTVKMQFDTIPQKIQNRCNLHPCEDENYSGFHFAVFIENAFSSCVNGKHAADFTRYSTVLVHTRVLDISHLVQPEKHDSPSVQPVRCRTRQFRRRTDRRTTGG